MEAVHQDTLLQSIKQEPITSEHPGNKLTLEDPLVEVLIKQEDMTIRKETESLIRQYECEPEGVVAKKRKSQKQKSENQKTEEDPTKQDTPKYRPVALLRESKITVGKKEEGHIVDEFGELSSDEEADEEADAARRQFEEIDRDQYEDKNGDEDVDESVDGDEGGAKQRKRADMTHDATKYLIQLAVPYDLEKQKIGGKKAKKPKVIWDEISSAMMAAGFIFNATQCTKRYQKLYQRYKMVHDHRKRTGQDKIKFQYEETFDEAFGDNKEAAVVFEIAECGDAAPASVHEINHPEGKGSDGIKEKELAARMQYYNSMVDAEQRRATAIEEYVQLKREELELRREELAFAREKLKHETKH